MYFFLLTSTPLPSQAIQEDAGGNTAPGFPSSGNVSRLGWFAWLAGEDTVFSEYLYFSRLLSDLFPETFSLVQLTTAVGNLLPEGGTKT